MEYIFVQNAKKLCGWRCPIEKSNLFFHFRIEPNCSLCYKDINQFNNFKYNEICNNAIETLIKNITKENWFETIDFLIRYDQLWRLEGCDFAIKPLCLYLEEKTALKDYENWDTYRSKENNIVLNIFELMDIDFKNYQIRSKETTKNNFYNKHMRYLIDVVENGINPGF
jgi:hypothetical protein